MFTPAGSVRAGEGLGAFDVHRNLIYAAAAKVYARGRKGSYDVVSSDF